jgi:RNA polymerase sigma-70 factor (ECF subfamily)
LGAEEPDDQLVDDRELASRIRDGDDAAFAALVDRFYPRVVGIAGRFFRRRDVLEDIAQEVFMKVYVGFASYRAEVPLQHWLSRIAVNACYDQLRRQRVRPETAVSQLTDDPQWFLADLADTAAASVPPLWEQEEAREAAENLLGLLSPADRLVLTLQVLEERSVAEIAALTGWTRANVKIRAFRARKRLRRLLAGAENRPEGRPS